MANSPTRGTPTNVLTFTRCRVPLRPLLSLQDDTLGRPQSRGLIVREVRLRGKSVSKPPSVVRDRKLLTLLLQTFNPPRMVPVCPTRSLWFRTQKRFYTLSPGFVTDPFQVRTAHYRNRGVQPMRVLHRFTSVVRFFPLP